MLDSHLRGNDKNHLFTRLSDPLQECPFNARRVPLKGYQFSKNWQFTTPFWPIFASPKSSNPYK